MWGPSLQTPFLLLASNFLAQNGASLTYVKGTRVSATPKLAVGTNRQHEITGLSEGLNTYKYRVCEHSGTSQLSGGI